MTDAAPAPVQRRRRTQAAAAAAAKAAGSSKRSATTASGGAGGGQTSGAKAAPTSKAASKAAAAKPVPPPKGMARLAVHPAASGPKIRLGILWFFLALAAVTAGRWPTAILWGVVAALASRELVSLWWNADGAGTAGGSPQGSAPAAVVALAVVLTPAVPAAAAFGTGFAGAVLMLVTLALAAVAIASRVGTAGFTPAQASTLAVAVLLPAIPAAAVVIAVAGHLWAGLFLVLAVSLYDAGCFIGGADSSSLLEGPVTGVVGVLAVTFTMAMFQAPPFDGLSAAIVGLACAVACPVGQWVASAFLPSVDAPARALRRLDAYIVAAPVFVCAGWILA